MAMRISSPRQEQERCQSANRRYGPGSVSNGTIRRGKVCRFGQKLPGNGSDDREEDGMTVYRGYDQAGLDAQYDMRRRHPECFAMFEDWRRLSAAVRAGRRCETDLVYDPPSGARLDLFLPDVPPPGGSALVMFLHGGYWQALDRSYFGYPAPPFLDRGIAFAAVGYTLAPAADMDEIVRQIRVAVLWLRLHARDFGIDPERIVACGHSAGGHLAAMLAATDWQGMGAGTSPPLAGACAISGLYDLEPIRLCYLNAALGLDAAAARRNSPIHRPPRRGVPLTCAVGGGETDEFLRQQRSFVDAWAAAAVPVATVDMPDADHFTIVDALANPATALFRAVADLATKS